MKEIIIQVKIIEDKTATIIKTVGFGDSISKTLEIIGILENLKQGQLNKLKNLSQIKDE